MVFLKDTRMLVREGVPECGTSELRLKWLSTYWQMCLLLWNPSTNVDFLSSPFINCFQGGWLLHLMGKSLDGCNLPLYCSQVLPWHCSIAFLPASDIRDNISGNYMGDMVNPSSRELRDGRNFNERCIIHNKSKCFSFFVLLQLSSQPGADS